jgi:hypothetical protein
MAPRIVPRLVQARCDQPTTNCCSIWGAAVLLCWNELSFSSQLKILAQTNDVIGTKPIPEARNEIVKLLLRHTKM